VGAHTAAERKFKMERMQHQQGPSSASPGPGAGFGAALDAEGGDGNDNNANATSNNEVEDEPKIIGNYEVERAIGKGKFAVVYRAKRISDGEVVALKRIKVEAIDAIAREKCLKEIRLLQSLDHPNIIRYLDSFISDNDLVIIIEWAAAGDLKRQLRKAQERKVGFEERIIWKYFSQICDAMQHMHEKRIMHRDLKPANIFLTLDGTIKVGDLGLSRELSEHTFQAHSKVGTPLYMSPEVLRGDGYDFKSDIWSLGCLLYELAMLKSPFRSEGLNLYSLFQKISQGDYQPLPDNYSETLRSLAYSMISTRSEERPELSHICSLAASMRAQTAKKGNTSVNSSSAAESQPLQQPQTLSVASNRGNADTVATDAVTDEMVPNKADGIAATKSSSRGRADAKSDRADRNVGGRSGGDAKDSVPLATGEDKSDGNMYDEIYGTRKVSNPNKNSKYDAKKDSKDASDDVFELERNGATGTPPSGTHIGTRRDNEYSNMDSVNRTNSKLQEPQKSQVSGWADIMEGEFANVQYANNATGQQQQTTPESNKQAPYSRPRKDDRKKDDKPTKPPSKSALNQTTSKVPIAEAAGKHRRDESNNSNNDRSDDDTVAAGTTKMRGAGGKTNADNNDVERDGDSSKLAMLEKASGAFALMEMVHCKLCVLEYNSNVSGAAKNINGSSTSSSNGSSGSRRITKLLPMHFAYDLNQLGRIAGNINGGKILLYPVHAVVLIGVLSVQEATRRHLSIIIRSLRK
jgi:serine/threonine protein kinase